MRQICQIHRIDGICGKPAVDFVIRDEVKFWLCAEHYDLLTRLRQILQEEIERDTNIARRRRAS